MILYVYNFLNHIFFIFYLAMVTLSARLAQMILSHVKISPILWSVLIKHTKPIGKSVRKTYIHFLMAFLFDGCTSVIKPLLEMKGKNYPCIYIKITALLENEGTIIFHTSINCNQHVWNRNFTLKKTLH